MFLLPLPSPILRPGDDLVPTLHLHEMLQSGDILVISSKAIATVEGAMFDLASMHVTVDARMWSEQTKRSPEFCQAVLQETERLNGTILRAVQGAMLTEVRPQGMTQGSILVANAGLDESNAEKGYAVGWPRDPVQSINQLLETLRPSPGGQAVRGGRGVGGEGIGIILSDSVCTPRRRGVTAIALACCGIDPWINGIGAEDLYGKKMMMTMEATADQLSTAANTLMGNAAQSIPAVIIRDHGLPFSDFCGWVPGIEAGEDLFGEMRDMRREM